jgi:zinc protease
MTVKHNIPQILPAEPFAPQEPDISSLSNGVKLYAFNRGEEDIVKIDIIFNAGIAAQTRPLQAAMAARMLKEGSRSYTSHQMAHVLDFHGAFLEMHSDYHHSIVSLFCLNKHLPKLMPMVASVVREPIFPEKEFSVIIENRKQEFNINQQKVKTLASKAFNKLLWGENHPYAIHAEEPDFNSLTTDHLLTFYQSNYSSANASVFVSGKITDETIALIDKYLCVSWNGKKHLPTNTPTVIANAEKQVFIEKNGVQSAIKAGRMVMGKQSPEFPLLQLLNCIFGGYFGSRLMRNIREDKGYTYGIGSYVVSESLGSYLAISTETANEYRHKVIEELYGEMNRLRNEILPNQELRMVKNYLGGELMRSFDGPFAIADVYRSLWQFGLDFSYIAFYLNAVEEATPEMVKQLAFDLLNPDDFKMAIAGKGDGN